MNYYVDRIQLFLYECTEASISPMPARYSPGISPRLDQIVQTILSEGDLAGTINRVPRTDLNRDQLMHDLATRSGTAVSAGAMSTTSPSFISTCSQSPTPAKHALSDPYRYRFAPRSWKSTHPMPGRLNQFVNRVPHTWTGTAGGATAGLIDTY